jgi:hypothetical protein
MKITLLFPGQGGPQGSHHRLLLRLRLKRRHPARQPAPQLKVYNNEELYLEIYCQDMLQFNATASI